MENIKTSGLLKLVGLLVIILAAVLIAVYLVTAVYHIIPQNFSSFVDALFIALLIYIILKIIVNTLRRFLGKYLEASSVHPILFIVNIIGYFVIGIAVLAELGVDVSSVILGGSLLSVVIGLAAQSVLSNQFAGIFLTVVRPFKVGDTVTINTWQYGGIYPTLFPKYFSIDRIEATAYTGVIKDISINYTVLEAASGDIVKMPNSIVIQGALIVRKSGINVQARYEVPKYIAFSSIVELVSSKIGSLQGVNGKPIVRIDETTMNSYIILVLCNFEGTDADSRRSEILNILMNTIEPMKSAAQ
jgi:small-conductance mechanosensitive channel